MCLRRLLLLLVLAAPRLASAAPPGGQGQAAALVSPRPVIRMGVPGCLVIVDTGRIFFDRRSAVITPVSYPILDLLADQLRKRPEIKRIRIEGHADGTEPDADELSWRRATAALLYLLGRSVEPWRLTTAGFGARCPHMPNDTPDNRSINRRINIVILQQEGVLLSAPVCRDPDTERGLVFREPERPIKGQRPAARQAKQAPHPLGAAAPAPPEAAPRARTP